MRDSNINLTWHGVASLQALQYEGDTVKFARNRRNIGAYRFPVDVHYDSGFSFAFLFTEPEAALALSVAKVRTLWIVSTGLNMR